MKKFFAFLLLISAPLMAQHSTQFAYYTIDTCQVIFAPGNAPSGSQSGDSQASTPSTPYTAIAWDKDTQVSTEGISLQGNATSESYVTLCNQQIHTAWNLRNTINIHHAGWYLAKFLVTGEAVAPQTLRFGLLNLDDLTLIPFGVYAVEAGNGEVEQLAGQVVFYASANTQIQLVNDGKDDIILNPTDTTTFLTSIYLVELLGR